MAQSEKKKKNRLAFKQRNEDGVNSSGERTAALFSIRKELFFFLTWFFLFFDVDFLKILLLPSLLFPASRFLHLCCRCCQLLPPRTVEDKTDTESTSFCCKSFVNNTSHFQTSQFSSTILILVLRWLFMFSFSSPDKNKYIDKYQTGLTWFRWRLGSVVKKI